MKALQVLMTLVFIVGVIVMMVGAKKSRNRMKNVGWIMVVVGCAYVIYWFVFRQ